MRGAWIEIYLMVSIAVSIVSLPMRGAWIEILLMKFYRVIRIVAPHAGSVD